MYVYIYTYTYTYIYIYYTYIYIIIWHSIWHLALAVEVRQCPLRSGARSWGLAVLTEIGARSWGREVEDEEEDEEEDDEEDDEEAEEGAQHAALIKSRHLTWQVGKKHTQEITIKYLV